MMTEYPTKKNRVSKALRDEYPERGTGPGRGMGIFLTIKVKRGKIVMMMDA